MEFPQRVNYFNAIAEKDSVLRSTRKNSTELNGEIWEAIHTKNFA